MAAAQRTRPPEAKATFHDVRAVSWQIAQAFAESKGLSLVSWCVGKTAQQLCEAAEYPRGARGKDLGAAVLEHCAFLLAELTAMAQQHTTEAAERKAERKAAASHDPARLAAAAQAAAASEGLTLAATAHNAKRKAAYEAAVELFESKKQGRATAAQLDRLWNEAEQEVHAQGEGAARGGRRRRKTRVRVGNAWIELN
jgi:hypothetical protein